MRNRYIISTAALAVFMSAGASYAADAVEVPPEPPISNDVYVEPAPVGGWSGVYVGAYGGYSWGEFDSSAGDLTADGWTGGGFVGGNLQSGSLVYGAEADIGYSSNSASLGATDVDQGLNGSLRARLGYAFDPFMLYGTAGVAATQAEIDTGTDSDQNTHLGWTVGAGGEALITQNIFGRVEYRYSDYESKDFDVDGTTISSGFSDHSVRAGIGLKF